MSASPRPSPTLLPRFPPNQARCRTEHPSTRKLKEEKDPAAAEKRLQEELSKSLTEEEKKKSEQTIAVQIKLANTPWFRYFLTLDPRPALRKVKCPVLALNGENDLQVPANENLREIEAALKAGGNNNVTIVRLPKLNHLFQTSETGSRTNTSRLKRPSRPSH